VFVFEFLVDAGKRVESTRCCGANQCAIFHSVPTHFARGADWVGGQMTPKPAIDIVVE
jgi:hypothetical protein